MQRFLALMSSGLLFSSLAHAQVGLRAGGMLTHLTTKSPDFSLSQTTATTDNKLGYQAGIYYQVKLGQRFSVVPEVQFSHENSGLHAFRSNAADGGYQGDYALSLNYVNLPFVARVRLGPVYVEAGPQISLLIGGREKGSEVYQGWAEAFYQAVDRNITNRYRRFDVGPCVGVGVDLPAGFGVSVRGFQGLVSSARNPASDPFNYYKGEVFRQTLQASLTYQLAAR